MISCAQFREWAVIPPEKLQEDQPDFDQWDDLLQHEKFCVEGPHSCLQWGIEQGLVKKEEVKPKRFNCEVLTEHEQHFPAYKEKRWLDIPSNVVEEIHAHLLDGECAECSQHVQRIRQ
jgi:hypothetical protein